MRNIASKLLMTTAFFSIIACSSTNRMTMGITQPAQVAIPNDVASVGIVDRSSASENNKVLDDIDKILSLEGLNLDKEGAKNAVSGLKYELERGNRFDAVKIIENQKDIEKGLRVFPSEISWDIVDRICKENSVDVLFSLEFYDTDTAANYELTTVKIPNNLGIEANVPGHRIELNTAVKNGWRIYDPVNRRIIDEYVSSNSMYSTGEGINPVKAFEAVVGRKEAVLSASSKLGANYALFTRPENIRIARDYYIKGSDNLEIADRRAKAGDWDGAAELWNADLTHAKSKIAGRAYYNMAISNEINGNLNAAIDFATKAYTEYENKDALRYINILKRRVVNQQELNRQLSR
ncbi:DUF6340 family protein [Maribacter sp. SA7]|uniref:DUF6340 family protein n=1 Tax=Maribacter zhoushanensis TaxID=3030012 RepID=UPI0023EDBF32|nr:DUF6340 family protein [Maribacter zhoushanensis]MDF4203237.1 DUF6340 family protein [Maribacter zhoushanensis]